KPDLFYHIDYRTYPQGTDVETFRFTALAGMDKEVGAVVKGLRTFPAPDEEVKGTAHGPAQPQPLKPGSSLRPVEVKGPQTINALYVLVGGAKDEADALRGLVLIATFDEEAKPQVWCPLGDFFGSAPGVNPYQALPFCVRQNDDGKAVALISHWPMPFAKSARFEIRNLSKQTPSVRLTAAASPRPWTERSLHFHAKWRIEALKSRPLRDWTYC